MEGQRCIALIAHDEKKNDMADFARHHQKALSSFRIVATGEVDMLIFFTDPLTAMPHDVDVRALNRATAENLIDFNLAS